jgi:SAM-dependent methyltransferase
VARALPENVGSADRVRDRCAWCGAEFDAGSLRLPGRTVCAACGVATTDPWPSEAELDAAYSGWYRPSEGRFAGAGDAVLRRSRGALARRLAAVAPPGPILDVGAGEGALLDALRAHGREGLGLERRASRPDIVDTQLRDVDGAFAAVVFWHSLEHLREPADALRDAVRLLVPGGLLVIAAPNAASLQARTFGDRWLALDLPRHLTHLTAQALVSRLREEGLRVERVSHLRGGQVVFGWLHGLVASLPGRLDLYAAIRKPAARSRSMSAPRRIAALTAGAVLLPVAALCAATEALLRRGGSVYVEARRIGSTG